MMTSMIPDYHLHTRLCGHAEGEPEEYAQKAISAGLVEIGFSDHAPFVHMVDPRVTMSMDQLPEYYRMMESTRSRFHHELVIKSGIEADFIPGFESQTKKIINDYPYDYVIGSVHFIKDWGFDDPDQRLRWDQTDVNTVYHDYYALLRQAAQSGLFDIMAHVDLPKKFGHRPSENMRNEVLFTADVFKEARVAIEINTAGLRKPVNEMYPALEWLKIYASAGVPLTFGSDAHQPEDVGRDFDQARRLALEAGYTESVVFRARHIERVIPL
jgi:histidinol-phosphatase (PHP family)